MVSMVCGLCGVVRPVHMGIKYNLIENYFYIGVGHALLCL